MRGFWWSFGDSSGARAEPSYAYAEPGTYRAIVWAADLGRTRARQIEVVVDYG